MKNTRIYFAMAAIASLALSTSVQAFSSHGQHLQRTSIIDRSPLQYSATTLRAVPNDTGEAESSTQIWLPKLRQVMGGIATAGALETAVLTYNKLAGQVDTLCGVDGNCQSVLTGPYSTVPFTDIPLSAAGFLAYVAVACLALIPLSDPTQDDSNNRVALTAATIGMATFSIFLMTLLFGVLQTTCPFCIFSAACSVMLAMLAWIGGCLPEQSQARALGARATSTTFLGATIGAILLFISADDVSLATFPSTNSGFGGGMTLLASSSSSNTGTKEQLFASPTITTESSAQALKLASALESMNAKMYGAYWCSHCFEQKELLGRQAFGKIQYVECAKDGVNSESKACRSREVPGYPTWEINGQLYPGEQELDELEELVQTIQQKQKQQ